MVLSSGQTIKNYFEHKHMLVCQYFFYMSKQRIRGYGECFSIFGAQQQHPATEHDDVARHRFDIDFHRGTKNSGTIQNPKLLFHPFISHCYVEGGFDNVSEST